MQQVHLVGPFRLWSTPGFPAPSTSTSNVPAMTLPFTTPLIILGAAGLLFSVCFILLVVWHLFWHLFWGQDDQSRELHSPDEQDEAWDNSEAEVLAAREAEEAKELERRNRIVLEYLEVHQDCVCGYCGKPGAAKIPSPLHWPNEKLPGSAFVHPECERTEVARAFRELLDRGEIRHRQEGGSK